MNCNYCEFRCQMPNSLCKMYEEKGGQIIEKYPNKWSSYHPNATESVPIYHALPNGQMLEVGSFNCNANCAYCINARVATIPENGLFLFDFKPERLAEMAVKSSCAGIHFGVNEFVVSLPSVLAAADAAAARGLIVGGSSNGFMTPEAAELIAAKFSYLNISLKSFSSDYYQKYTGLPSVEPILRNIAYFADKLHLEITTPVVQGLNDHELPAITDFLAKINPDIAWHIFRLTPQYKMEDRIPPDINELTVFVEQARKKLPFTYFSNFIGSPLDNTICPVCGEILMERICRSSCGAVLLDNYLTGENRCARCGYRFPMADLTKGGQK